MPISSTLADAWPTVAAAFLASTVEFVEALTIVLAVGAVRGWRPALQGAGVATVLLAVLVAVFGPSLARWQSPLFQLTIGVLLLLFGLRWLCKAILRAAGVIALRNEDDEYTETEEALEGGAGAFLTAFNGVLIEGLEVIFLVISMGAARQRLLPASLGAVLAAGLVLVLGVIARRPLSQIPENALKLAVGILVSAFGTLLTAEGLGLCWPTSDAWTPVALSVAWLGIAGIGVTLARAVSGRPLAR